jgi:phospholipase C
MSIPRPSRGLAAIALAMTLTLAATACTSPGAGPRSATPSGSGTPPPTDDPTPTPTPRLKGFENIQHVVFIVQENRSFDHYFGTFPGADGIPMTKDGEPAVCVPDPVLGDCAEPFHDDSLVQRGGPHGQPHSVVDVNGGAMDGFVRVLVAGPNECADDRTIPSCRDDLGPDLQPDVMGWHDAREIPNYWAYAERFVLQDHMFAPADSWTLPAHLFLVSAWSASCTDPQDPMSCRSDLGLEGVVDRSRTCSPRAASRGPTTWATTPAAPQRTRARASATGAGAPRRRRTRSRRSRRPTSRTTSRTSVCTPTCSTRSRTARCPRSRG